MSIGTAKEKGTFVIPVTFTDEAGAALTPDSITWTLSYSNGGIVNSRTGVSIAAASSINIVLSGDDLAVIGNDDLTRKILVYIVYDSSYGNNLPQYNEETFTISNLTNVT